MANTVETQIRDRHVLVGVRDGARLASTLAATLAQVYGVDCVSGVRGTDNCVESTDVFTPDVLRFIRGFMRGAWAAQDIVYYNQFGPLGGPYTHISKDVDTE